MPDDKPELDAQSKAIIDEEIADAKTKGDLIPKERLDAVLAQLKDKDTQNVLLQNQMDILKANLPSQIQQQTAQTKPADIFDGIFKPDDEVVGKDQLIEFGRRLINQMSLAQTSISTQVNNAIKQARHNDFDQVIQNHLPAVLKADPELVPELQEIYKTNPGVANAIAYRLAKIDPAYQEKINQEKTAQTDTQKQQQMIAELLKSKNLPQSISAIGSGGGATIAGGSKLTQILQEAENDEDFQKLHQDLLSGHKQLPKE